MGGFDEGVAGAAWGWAGRGLTVIRPLEVEPEAVGVSGCGGAREDDLILMRFALRSESPVEGPAIGPSVPGRMRLAKGGSGGVRSSHSFFM